VLPSQMVLPLLRRDPRLVALLPASGSPLWWNLLLRPAGGHPAPPLDWLRAIRRRPLLDRLLAAGWVPPLPREELKPSLALWPREQARLLDPDPAVLARCTNLGPLDAAQRQLHQGLWDAAA
jgi:putative spermidine/putrescine transport system substrate-binding protein